MPKDLLDYVSFVSTGNKGRGRKRRLSLETLDNSDANHANVSAVPVPLNETVEVGDENLETEKEVSQSTETVEIGKDDLNQFGYWTGSFDVVGIFL